MNECNKMVPDRIKCEVSFNIILIQYRLELHMRIFNCILYLMTNNNSNYMHTYFV
jgi:hypothetical protein